MSTRTKTVDVHYSLLLDQIRMRIKERPVYVDSAVVAIRNYGEVCSFAGQVGAWDQEKQGAGARKRQGQWIRD